MQHLDEGTIHAWLDGALDAEESARVEEHTAACATCAAAVADARGLVAGASRILSALDDVPAGVIPRSPAATEIPLATRRSSSVWHRLRLTPARAAAAAVVFLAAGTALVLRTKPNDTERASVQFVQFHPDSAAGGAGGAVKAAAPTAPAISLPSPTASAPGPMRRGTVRSGRPASRAEANASVAPAPTEPRASVAAVDSASATDRLTSAASKKLPAAVAAPAPPARAEMADAAKRSVAAGTGAVSGAASAAPMTAQTTRPQFAPSAAVVLARSGCYSVRADSSAGFPDRLILDSIPVTQLEPAAGRAALRRDASADRHAVSVLVGGTRRVLESWSWLALPGGGIRLSIGGATPRVIQLIATDTSTLRSVATGADGRSSIILQRTSCPAP
jgi:anti-sigma factor RsiW